jgi:hypothetical protein
MGIAEKAVFHTISLIFSIVQHVEGIQPVLFTARCLLVFQQIFL